MNKINRQINLRYRKQKLIEDMKMTEILIKYAEKCRDYETQISAERKLLRQQTELGLINTALEKLI